ncbi:Imm15 family immunity protein [Pseudomonas sp. W2-17]|uniref:Imm15 family immunity protein n=1 Tax=Pseudomonas sp. W2-17 TaxID=3058039 RepID=UPI0034E0D40C
MEHSTKMNLTDLYRKIISKEPYNDMGVFFLDYETFEELPMTSRYDRLNYLKKEMTDEKATDFLVGLSAFLLNSIGAISCKPKNAKPFFAITFTDFEALKEFGVLIPNIFIYPHPGSIGFLDKIEKSSSDASQEINLVKMHFSHCGIADAFEFYESRFYDSACGEDFVRVFAVQKNCRG